MGLLAALACGCNDVFDIQVGALRPPCPSDDVLLIDDMEDGAADICPIAGRGGRWYTESDGTSGMLSQSPELEFAPTLLPDGWRSTSRWAAHLSGDGFSGWGVLLGLDLSVSDLARQPYDASSAGGIRFWMKSDVPVRVELQLPETTTLERAGTCTDSENGQNCDNHFGFTITLPAAGWSEYEVPFSALSQVTNGLASASGSASWTPRELLGIDFWVGSGDSFNLWIDDVRFYNCTGSECLPTCSDPLSPLSSPAGYGFPAGCGIEQRAYTDVWGSRSSDVWTVGRYFRHWDGTEWSTPVLGAEDVRGVWGSGANDIWAVGDYSTVFHYDGFVWSRRFTSDFAHFYAIWGSAADDVWAVGSDGAIEHWDGQLWSAVESGTTETLLGVWGSGPNDVWAVGVGGSIVQFDGSIWSPSVPPPGENRVLNGVWGSGPDDVWAMGEMRTALHWDGSAWSVVPGPGAPILGVWGSAANEVWAVGGLGRVQHWDGSSWSAEETSTTRGLLGVWGSGAGDVWAVGDGDTLLHRSDSGWSALSGGDITGYGNSFREIWGSGPDDIWITGGSDGRFHWDGAGWTKFEATGSGVLIGVWGSATQDVWGIFSYGGSVTHWDGLSWSEPRVEPGLGNPSYGLYDIGGSAPDDIWVVGTAGLYHWDGALWGEVPGGAEEVLTGVWASSATTAWAVGYAGAILRWNGAAWSPVSSGTDENLAAVAGSGPRDVWAVGDDIVHWDGSAWSPVVSPTRQPLRGVWARAEDDAWIVGDRGTILRWDGSAWLQVSSPVPSALNVVWGSAADDVWVAGNYGVLLHWDGASWTQFELSW